MNPEQIKIGMKISKKISKKNNKHGPLKSQSEIYTEAVSYLGSASHPKLGSTILLLSAFYNRPEDEFIKQFNKWINNCKDKFESDEKIKRIFEVIQKFTEQDKAPNYEFDKESFQYKPREQPKNENIPVKFKYSRDNVIIKNKLNAYKIAEKENQYNNFYDILDDIITRNDFTSFNNWRLRNSKRITGNGLYGKFDNYVLYDNWHTNWKYNPETKIFEKIKEETETPIVEKVPESKTKKEQEKQEISELSDQRDLLQKVTETVEQSDKIKEESEKVLDELSEAHEDQINQQKIELEKRLENKKSKQKSKPKIENETNNETSSAQSAPEIKPETKNLTNEEIVQIFNKYPSSEFKSKVMKKDQFLDILKNILNDGKYRLQRELILKNLDKYKTTRKRIQTISTFIKAHKFDEKFHAYNNEFDEFRDKFERYMENKLPGFKIGDKIPDDVDIKTDVNKIIKSINFKWNDDTKAKLNKIFDKYGFKIKYIANKTGNSIQFDDFNKSYRREMKDRKWGKVETNPDNSKDFFSYDIHEIYHIIEKGLKIKLSNEVKTDIESLIRMETSNLINHLNISHGSSNIQNIIVEIEKYISSRMKDKTKTFKFTESNRYKLKELLTRFLNNSNGKESKD